jgi:ribosomal subunit interface protein
MSLLNSDDVQITTRGQVPDRAREYAGEKVARAAASSRGPVVSVEVILTQGTNPAHERPATAEATIDLNGRRVRAHVAAPDMFEAIDILDDRLCRRLRRYEQRLHHDGRARHDIGSHPPGEWRHHDLPTQRPEYYPRPYDERDLVRTKVFALAPVTIEEAAFDLELSGHDFYIFTELESGADAVVYYRDDGRIGLQLPEGITAGPGIAAADVDVVPPAPLLSTHDAIERLEVSGEQFVFFIRSETGRGGVLYHRYDGHWGLISAG